MTPRYVVESIGAGRGKRWYVRDTRLGYCTEPVASKRAAQNEATDRNRADV